MHIYGKQYSLTAQLFLCLIPGIVFRNNQVVVYGILCFVNMLQIKTGKNWMFTPILPMSSISLNH